MNTFMKKWLLTLFNLFLVCFSLFGQGENNVWYFGHNCGLDFNPGSPVAITSSPMDQWEGVATASDAIGNVLFYTDGITVWNAFNIPMPNGNNLKGHYSSTHSATVVPKPGSNTEYYIFTCPILGNDSMRYSVVDMSLAGGMGDVTLKNAGLFAHSSEKCVAVYKYGSADAWVIGHNSDTVFYSYLLTAGGIAAPVMSYHQPNQGTWAIGYLRASPQGTKLATALYTPSQSVNKFALFDFDCVTGAITNGQFITTSYQTYGLEFSPDGSKLYVFPWAGGNTPILQYDITLPNAAAIAASQVTVGTSTGAYLGTGQIGPDQKIYIAINNEDSMSVINNPNLPGNACNFVNKAIDLGGKISGIGLPAQIRGSNCNATSVAETGYSPYDFDVFPNPSNGTITIIFPQAGSKNYTVEVFNTLSQKVFYSYTNGTLTIPITTKGMYILKINDGEKIFATKIIVE